MNNTHNRWMSAFFLLAMFSIVALAGGRATQAASNVLVTNPTTQPANVKQIGYLQTYILGTPGVRVYNPVYAPVPVRQNDEPGRNAYAKSWNIDFPGNTTYAYVEITPPPAGKRLILTHVSANCTTTDGASVARVVAQDQANSRISYRPFFLTADPGGTGQVQGSMDCFLKIDHTDTVEIYVYRKPTSAFASVYVDLEGYYVVVP
jgi:hypothetical protein